MGCSLAMKAKGLVLVSLVAVISILGAGVGAGTVQPSRIVRQVPAMYVFGGSTRDVGNNNFLPWPSVPRANKPWYGVDFPGCKATGRFSNGYNIADFVAMTLGLKESPPAYLSLAPHPISLVLSAASTGVNYASGGAGILDWTGAGNLGYTIPLSQQLRYFQSTKALMMAKVGSRPVSDLLARSFFLISVGSNDLSAFANSDVAALYTILISSYSAAITGLYEMGARKFGIINVGPIGCLPFARVSIATGACNDTLNLVAAGFDDALRSLFAGLASTLPGVTYSLADNFGLQQDTFANPQASGFVNIHSACCGSGWLGADQSGCLPNSKLCANRDHFFWWDRFHFSQRFGKLSAAAYYDGPAQFTFPINFKQLAIQE